MPRWSFFVRTPDGWAALPDTLTGDLKAAERECARLACREGEAVCADQSPGRILRVNTRNTQGQKSSASESENLKIIHI